MHRYARAQHGFLKLAMVGSFMFILAFGAALPAAAQSDGGSSSMPAAIDEAAPDAAASDAPQDVQTEDLGQPVIPGKPVPTPAPNPYQGLPTGC